MKRLIFDAQIFQTPALDRGMGKYSLELVRSIMKDNEKAHTWKEVVVILSKRMPVDEGLKKELMSVKHLTIEMLDLVSNDPFNPALASQWNRDAIDAFVGEGKDDVYLILSLMQGEISPVYPSSDLVHKSVLFYDLIPFMFHKNYLNTPIEKREYLSKIGELIKSDSFLAISKTVANDLSIYLGIPPSMITSIDGGPIRHDTGEEPYAVSKSFILMPTGHEIRKNNRRAVEAFEIFNQRHRRKYTLVVTSFFRSEEVASLRSLSEDVIFTGNVSGAQLNFLYQNADLVLFPSEYEGLGLPVLEALEHQTPVVCSDISVFREISQSAFTYFNPKSVNSIANALETGITTTVDLSEAREILAKYNWQNTAAVARKFLSQKLVRHPRIATKLCIVSPDAAGMERGIGKFITQLHASLQVRFSIMYYQEKSTLGDDIAPRPSLLPYIAPFEYLAQEGPVFTQEFDSLPCYHISNNVSCLRILMGALVNPGIVMLHDLNLDTLWQGLLAEGLISKERYDLEQKLAELYGGNGLVSLLAASRGIVVFLKQAEKIAGDIVDKLHLPIKVALIPLPTNGLVYSEVAPTATSKELSLSEVKDLDDMQYEIALSYCSEFTRKEYDLGTDALLAEVEAMKYHPRTSQPLSDDYAAFVNKLGAFIESIDEKRKP